MAYRNTVVVNTNQNHFGSLEEYLAFHQAVMPEYTRAVRDLRDTTKQANAIVTFSESLTKTNEYTLTRTWVSRDAYDTHLRAIQVLGETIENNWENVTSQLGWTTTWSEQYEV
jgi:hypothetical protein